LEVSVDANLGEQATVKDPTMPTDMFIRMANIDPSTIEDAKWLTHQLNQKVNEKIAQGSPIVTKPPSKTAEKQASAAIFLDHSILLSVAFVCMSLI
jgi:hypothetical protein